MNHHYRVAHPLRQLLIAAALASATGACSDQVPPTAATDRPSAAVKNAVTFRTEVPSDADTNLSVPSATSPLVPAEDLAAINNTAASFLAVFWSPTNTGLTIGQLGQRLAPFTTDSFAAAYQDPAHRDQSANASDGTVGAPTFTIASADHQSAVVVARADSASPVTGRRPLWLTLRLVHQGQAWLIEALG